MRMPGRTSFGNRGVSMVVPHAIHALDPVDQARLRQSSERTVQGHPVESGRLPAPSHLSMGKAPRALHRRRSTASLAGVQRRPDCRSRSRMSIERIVSPHGCLRTSGSAPASLLNDFTPCMRL